MRGQKISLQNLSKPNRGFPKSMAKKFKWYSWLRFKDFVGSDKKELENVLGCEREFSNYVKKVHDHYTYNPGSIAG